jgi:hypothetical protein
MENTQLHPEDIILLSDWSGNTFCFSLEPLGMPNSSLTCRHSSYVSGRYQQPSDSSHNSRPPSTSTLSLDLRSSVAACELRLRHSQVGQKSGEEAIPGLERKNQTMLPTLRRPGTLKIPHTRTAYHRGRSCGEPGTSKCGHVTTGSYWGL